MVQYVGSPLESVFSREEFDFGWHRWANYIFLSLVRFGSAKKVWLVWLRWFARFSLFLSDNVGSSNGNCQPGGGGTNPNPKTLHPEEAPHPANTRRRPLIPFTTTTTYYASCSSCTTLPILYVLKKILFYCCRIGLKLFSLVQEKMTA